MFYRRTLSRSLIEACQDSPVVLVNGARQTGKSTLVQSLFSGPDRPDYLTFDDITVLAAATSAPQDFVDALPSRAILDEVQRAPELFVAVKRAVDRDRKPGRFLLTGSANVLTLPKLSDSLAGRMEVHTLWPLSQGERLGRTETFVDTLFESPTTRPAGEPITARALAESLVAGGYPEAVQRDGARRRGAWFRGYLTTILQRDVTALSQIEGLTALPDLLRLLAARSGGLHNTADLSRSLSLPGTTLRRYLTLLEAVFLVVPLPAWSANIGKRLAKSPKLHLNDTGLLCHLLGIDVDALLTDRKRLGAVLETFVAMEITKQLGWVEIDARLHHFRTTAGQEVDLVLEAADGRLVGIEVKAASAITAEAFAGLKTLKDATGDRFYRGVVLYTGDRAHAFGPDLHALPISALWAA